MTREEKIKAIKAMMSGRITEFKEMTGHSIIMPDNKFSLMMASLKNNEQVSINWERYVLTDEQFNLLLALARTHPVKNMPDSHN